MRDGDHKHTLPLLTSQVQAHKLKTDAIFHNIAQLAEWHRSISGLFAENHETLYLNVTESFLSPSQMPQGLLFEIHSDIDTKYKV